MSKNVFEIKDDKNRNQNFHLVVKFSRKLVKSRIGCISHTRGVLKTLARVQSDKLNTQLYKQVSRKLIVFAFLSP